MKRIIFILGAIFLSLTLFWFYLNQNYSTPILMYHSFDAARIKDYSAVKPQIFHKQMDFIKNSKYSVISLDQYCQRLKQNKTIPPKSLVITIDDGYKDNLEAVKVLKNFDYPATFFVIADKIGQEGYLSAKDIRSFLRNTKIQIGSHTLTHDYLPDLTDEQIKKEIHGSKELLQKEFLQEIETIAYPIGGFTDKVLTEVQAAQYLCACSTNRGLSKKPNLFALQRIKITNRDLGFRLRAKLSGFYNAFKKAKKPF